MLMRMRKTHKFLKAISVLVILILVFAAYGAYRERVAKPQSIEFCASVKVGDATEGLLERAIQSGAEARLTRWRAPQNESPVLMAIFVGMPPFSRHICVIRATERVISAQYTYLD